MQHDDRYHELLGLDPDVSSPNLFQLLNVDSDKLSEEEVEKRFKEQMTKLQHNRSPKHKEFIEYLKGELKTARRTLTDDEALEEYKDGLKRNATRRLERTMKPVLAEGRLSDRGEKALIDEAIALGLTPEDARAIITEALGAAGVRRESPIPSPGPTSIPTPTSGGGRTKHVDKPAAAMERIEIKIPKLRESPKPPPQPSLKSPEPKIFGNDGKQIPERKGTGPLAQKSAADAVDEELKEKKRVRTSWMAALKGGIDLGDAPKPKRRFVPLRALGLFAIVLFLGVTISAIAMPRWFVRVISVASPWIGDETVDRIARLLGVEHAGGSTNATTELLIDTRLAKLEASLGADLPVEAFRRMRVVDEWIANLTRNGDTAATGARTRFDEIASRYAPVAAEAITTLAASWTADARRTLETGGSHAIVAARDDIAEFVHMCEWVAARGNAVNDEALATLKAVKKQCDDAVAARYFALTFNDLAEARDRGFATGPRRSLRPQAFELLAGGRVDLTHAYDQARIEFTTALNAATADEPIGALIVDFAVGTGAAASRISVTLAGGEIRITRASGGNTASLCDPIAVSPAIAASTGLRAPRRR
jgi:hypothetical protein